MRELAEPYLREVLGTAGLDVEYVRAEGTTLYHLDENGAEVPVLDLVGGFASTLLGHNNPELVAHAKGLLDAGVPVLAQFSRHSHANQVAERLNEILRREVAANDDYFAIFANSGAEGIEAAVKHAEFDRTLRLAALDAEIREHVEQADRRVADGTARVAEGTYELLGLDHATVDFAGIATEVVARNAELMARPPIFLTLENGFHGKLIGSVQLTHNESFRAPFARLATPARFVPRHDVGALGKLVAPDRPSLLDLEVRGDLVTAVERPFPAHCAFLLEPVQGEGGMAILSEEFAAEVRRVCDELDCPVIVDEIQSGVGRTGTFLASAWLGLRAEYYVLAKGLGGGIGKMSVTLVHRSRYREEFELVHSSTFAKDGFSTMLALRMLELLESDGGRVYRRVAERGERLGEMLADVAAEFHDVVDGVRGTGLMRGIAFRDLSHVEPPIGEVARADFLGYVIAGYLLRHHRVRSFPTASATNTLRFTPSVELTDGEIGQLEAALRDVCDVLRARDGQRLMPTRE